MLTAVLLGTTTFLSIGSAQPPPSMKVAETPNLAVVEANEPVHEPQQWWTDAFGFKGPGVFREQDPTMRLRLAALFHIAHVRTATAVCRELEVASESVGRLLERTGLGRLSRAERRFVTTRSRALRERWQTWTADETCDWAYGHYGPNGAMHGDLVRRRPPQAADPEVTSALRR